MTFKTFEKIVAAHRPDVIVSQHGDYCNNKSKNTLGIIFVKPDGRQSRTYDYHGTYAEIIAKLNIPIVTKSDIACVKADLERYQEMNGTESIFAFDDEVLDYSKEIAETEQRLNYLLTSDEVVREWEY